MSSTAPESGTSTFAFASDALQGRHVLITGASSGLGRASAVVLAACGARLSLVGRAQEQLDKTIGMLGAGEHSAHIVALDDAEVAADAVQAIAKERGPFDGMFYSAGSTMVLPIRLLKNKHLHEAFGAGLWGVFGVLRAAARKGVMVDGGSIVVMSSVAAMRGRPALSAYCAAKAGVDALVRCAALEFAERRIRVNSIRAAAVETAMHHQFMASIGEEAARDYTERHPLGFGQPEDVANQVVYLLSDASRWVSGTNIPVDGAAAVK